MKLSITLLAVLLLTGCGTNALNNRIAEDNTARMNAFQLASSAHSKSCSTAAAGCSEGAQGDLCRVATLLACNTGSGQLKIPEPQPFRSPAQDFAVVFGPIANTILGIAQVGVTAYGIDRQAATTIRLGESRDQRDIAVAQSHDSQSSNFVNSLSGVIGQGFDNFGNLPPTTSIGGDNIEVGGNFGDTAGQDIIGGDRGGDVNVGGDQVGGDQNQAGGNIGDTDNSVPLPDDGLPPGVFPLPGANGG